MVNMTQEPTAELTVIRGGGLRLSAVTAPLKTFLSSSPIPTSSQPRTSLQSGAGRAEDGPSHRQNYIGSVYSGERKGAWQTLHSNL